MDYKRKLLEWDLQEYVQNFESEGIDDETFRLIDDDTLKLLIPKGGPRLKFKHHFNKFLLQSSSNETWSVQNFTLIPSSANHIIGLNDSSSSNLSASPFQSNLSESPCPSNLSESPLPSDPFPPSNDSPSFLTPSAPEPCPSTSHCGKKLDLRHIVGRKLPDILKKLDETDQINILEKHRLNRLIVDSYIEEYGCRANTKEKIDLARDIVTTFPALKSPEGEGFEQWFCPGAKGTASSGFIAQRFRNFRQRKLSKVEKSELGIGKTSRLPKKSILNFCGKEDKSADFLQKQQWLKENDKPVEKVLQLMQETFQGRRFEVTHGVLVNIIQAWPRIINPQVIDAEFTAIYGEKTSDSLCLQFGLIATQIILQAKNCGRKSVEDIVNNLEIDLNDSNASTEKVCCAILLLPLLLPQGVISQQIGSKKRKIRPTSAQSLDHFVQFIPIGEGIDKFMQEDRLLGGQRKQPFVLAIGEKYCPSQTFVVFENYCIEANSLLKAVDLCFKLTYILNLEFSMYCRNVWHFINETFFKCEFGGVMQSCVKELKNRLFIQMKE